MFRAWLTEAETFEKVGEDWRPGWAVQQRARLAEGDPQVQRLRSAGQPLARSYEVRRGRLETRIAGLLAEPWVAGRAGDRQRRRQAIERDVADWVAGAQAAGRQVGVDQAVAALEAQTQLGDRAHASAAVDATWRAVCAAAAREMQRDGQVAITQARVLDAKEHLSNLIDPTQEAGLAASRDLSWDGADPVSRRLTDVLQRHVDQARERCCCKSCPPPPPSAKTSWPPPPWTPPRGRRPPNPTCRLAEKRRPWQPPPDKYRSCTSNGGPSTTPSFGNKKSADIGRQPLANRRMSELIPAGRVR